MIGIQLSVDGAPFVKACLEKGLLINCTQGTVLRFLPAMNLSEELFDEGCSLLESVFEQVAENLVAKQ
jgi:acetylornithine/succinyldiaminopimelate/putrescine aminotransferase